MGGGIDWNLAFIMVPMALTVIGIFTVLILVCRRDDKPTERERMLKDLLDAALEAHKLESKSDGRGN